MAQNLEDVVFRRLESDVSILLNRDVLIQIAEIMAIETDWSHYRQQVEVDNVVSPNENALVGLGGDW